METAVSHCKRANCAAHAIHTAAENARIAEAPVASMRKAILLLLKGKCRLKGLLFFSDAQKSKCPMSNFQRKFFGKDA